MVLTQEHFYGCLVCSYVEKTMWVTIRFMLVGYSLQHSFDDLVDRLNLAISLCIVRIGELMCKTQLQIQCMKYLIILKVWYGQICISYEFQSEWWHCWKINEPLCETCCDKGLHNFCPFGRAVNSHNDVLVVTTRCRMTFLKFDPPFTKGINAGNGMHWSK